MWGNCQALQQEGWSYRAGTGLVTWRYLSPGAIGKIADMTKGADYFESEAEVAAYLASKGDLAAVLEQNLTEEADMADDGGSGTGDRSAPYVDRGGAEAQEQMVTAGDDDTAVYEDESESMDEESEGDGDEGAEEEVDSEEDHGDDEDGSGEDEDDDDGSKSMDEESEAKAGIEATTSRSIDTDEAEDAADEASGLVWAELWPELQKHGWRYRAGEGLVSWVWLRPGVKGKLSQLELGVDYFESEEAVMSYLQQQRRCVEERRLVLFDL